MKKKYIIHCSKCNLVVDSELESEECPPEPKNKKIVWSPSSGSEPSFTQKIYPFYHQGIGEVVHSEKQMKSRCSELGFYSKHEGAIMNRKQYTITKEFLNGQRQTEQVATTAAVLQTNVIMPINSVAFVKMVPTP